MKQTIKSYTFTILFLFISTFISALTLTILKQINLLSYSASKITINILSMSLFFISAIILGLKQKRKGLINGLFLSIIYVIISLIIKTSLNNFIDILRFSSKILLIMLGTIIGVNLKKE